MIKLNAFFFNDDAQGQSHQKKIFVQNQLLYSFKKPENKVDLTSQRPIESLFSIF